MLCAVVASWHLKGARHCGRPKAAGVLCCRHQLSQQESRACTQLVQQRPCSAGGGVTTQFGGPIAAALFVLWLALAFLGWILALAGLSALQNKIYKESNAVGAAPHMGLHPNRWDCIRTASPE